MTRIHGLDLARVWAIVGMMAAHIGPSRFLTDGYPSVLFAVLAGVSMGIISSRTTAPADARFALLTRAVILVGLGVLLDALQHGIAVVLTAIGVSYILLLPVLGWRARWQVVLLAGLVVLGPLVLAVQYSFPFAWESEFFDDLVNGPYPLTAWLAYTLLGLLIHRLALRREAVLLSTGLAVFALAQITLELTDFRTVPYDELNLLGEWLQGEPHSGGLLDVLGSAGLAAALIGACLLACRLAALVWVTYPLRAFGAMSLTIYVTHVIITTIANGTFVGLGPVYSLMSPEQADSLWPELFLWQLLGFLVFASLWRWRFRRGPAEWAVGSVVAATTSPAKR